MTFSESVLKNNNLNKTCTCCGQKTVYYKKRLRTITIEALQFIFKKYTYKYNDSFSLPIFFTIKKIKDDLYNTYEAKHATEIFKHYTLAKYFGLIEDDILINTSKLTKKGIEFLKGNIAIPEYIYGNRRGHYLAEELGLPPAPNLFIKEFTQHDESDAILHYTESLPIEQL